MVVLCCCRFLGDDNLIVQLYLEEWKVQIAIITLRIPIEYEGPA